MTIKILQNFKASIDGFNLVEFKKDEILEGSDERLTPHFMKWARDNQGFIQEGVEKKSLKQKIENKAIFEAPENKEVTEEEVIETESEEKSTIKRSLGKKRK